MEPKDFLRKDQMTDLESGQVLTLQLKGIWKRVPGGAHSVHFENSLLHDSVTTIRVAPG